MFRAPVMDERPDNTQPSAQSELSVCPINISSYCLSTIVVATSRPRSGSNMRSERMKERDPAAAECDRARHQALDVFTLARPSVISCDLNGRIERSPLMSPPAQAGSCTHHPQLFGRPSNLATRTPAAGKLGGLPLLQQRVDAHQSISEYRQWFGVRPARAHG